MCVYLRLDYKEGTYLGTVWPPQAVTFLCTEGFAPSQDLFLLPRCSLYYVQVI